MATRTKGGALLPVIILVAAVAVFGGDKVVDTMTGLFTGGGRTILGEGDSRVMVATAAESDAKQCETPQMLADRWCGDLHVLLVDANKIPFIARNTQLAWESGRPGVLTMNRAKQDENRRIACPRSFSKKYGGQCDEYPMASTSEGGGGARTEEVPGRENSCQGGMYGAQYPKDGQRFLVVIVHLDQIATEAFSGTDIAKDKGLC
ncbi:NucA/NucB deoxyribonuclease domain-containing protein [Actinokineospora spheciospongiae]|uniref:NucA/NucB deoxyribonuclease domain-containing protein n=1 Tax=Actinokineospora spheciospongiae TaxID=909613 RepID=UPI000552DEF2|nr:NucA/NucB deoxyribonuclease domain-containing protein [Actinokineospora spheciospongiae]